MPLNHLAEDGWLLFPPLFPTMVVRVLRMVRFLRTTLVLASVSYSTFIVIHDTLTMLDSKTIGAFVFFVTISLIFYVLTMPFTIPIMNLSSDLIKLFI
jgi:hypothetical protein